MKNNEIFIGPWRGRTSCQPGGYGPSRRGGGLAPVCDSQSIGVLQKRGMRGPERSPNLLVWETPTGGGRTQCPS